MGPMMFARSSDGADRLLFNRNQEKLVEFKKNHPHMTEFLEEAANRGYLKGAIRTRFEARWPPAWREINACRKSYLD